MGLVGITFLAWMIVRAAWQILTWAVLLAWLMLRGVWYLLVTLPRRAWRKHQANVGYQRLIEHLVTGFEAAVITAIADLTGRVGALQPPDFKDTAPPPLRFADRADTDAW